MSIAALLVPEMQRSVATTFRYGYMVMFDGKRRTFPPARIIEEKYRDERCTLCVAEYADGSRVVFTWSERRGPRFRALAPQPA